MHCFGFITDVHWNNKINVLYKNWFRFVLFYSISFHCWLLLQKTMRNRRRRFEALVHDLKPFPTIATATLNNKVKFYASLFHLSTLKRKHFIMFQSFEIAFVNPLRLLLFSFLLFCSTLFGVDCCCFGRSWRPSIFNGVRIKIKLDLNIPSRRRTNAKENLNIGCVAWR